MSNRSFIVSVVDDEPGVLKALTRLLQAAGYESRAYSSSREFLAAYDPSVHGCVILDVCMPDLDGLRLQQKLNSEGISCPIIFLTGSGDIPMSVRAIKAGAVDFLTKPVKCEHLIPAIERAAEMSGQARQNCERHKSIDDKLATLTRREREVLTYVISGRLNKQIAASIGTVEKTVKVHRGRVMAKLGIRNVVDLVRFSEQAGIEPHL
jgi:FixJ family two-component response regulator